MRESKTPKPSDDSRARAASLRQAGRAGNSSIVRLAGAGLLVCGFVWIPGCAHDSSTTQPSTMYDRQQQALRDPFGYNPNLKKSDMSVSGNGEFDKQGLQRDVNDVLNP